MIATVASPDRRPRLGCVLLILAILPPMAQDQEPDAVIQAEGLKKVGNGLVLPAEAELARSLSALQKLQKEYNQVAALLRQSELDMRQARRMLPQLIEQRLFLNQQLREAREGGASTQQYNQIVSDFNEVNDRINLLQLRSAEDKGLQAVREQVASKREALIQSSLAIRKILDQADARYEELAGFTALSQAIERSNRQSKVQVSLGPSKSYLANRKVFEKISATLLSETISVRMDGGISLIDVTLNEKLTRPMVFDTGASMVSLSAELATAAGVVLGPEAATIQVTVADGRKFEARRGVLNSIRVGKFAVEQVDCIVMPAEFANAPALLGGSFLRHFTVKLDQAGQSVTLSRVAEEPAPPTTGRKR
ncbi:MAG: retroviral-like aspartic protease family protein [Isosphaeraceae bacterium]